MNHQEFGALVASLRDDLRWSQAELAEKAEVGLAVLNEIEAGRRRSLLEDDTLIRMANGLQLTSLERREFLLAASGVTELEMLRPDIGSQGRQFDIASLIKTLAEQIAILRVPAYVSDVFCDILLANNAAVAYFHPPASMLEEAAATVGGYNQMNYVFHRDSTFTDLIDEGEWDAQALFNVRHFRKRTMRYRSKSYYSALVKKFLNTRKYPFFERYWRKVSFEIHDDYALPIEMPDAKKDRAYVQTETLVALTPYGELYLHQMIPLNSTTLKKMEALLKQTGVGCHEFARLPDRRKV